MPNGMNQKRRTSAPSLPPRSAEITTSASVTGASKVTADFMSMTRATSGVATSGKPKPSAPCTRPASTHTSAMYASTSTVTTARSPRRQHFGQVQRRAPRQRLDLLAAGEAARHHHRVLRTFQRRQQREPGDAARGLDMLGLVAERPGHAAAAGIRRDDFAARGREQVEIGLGAAYGVLVTVRMHQHAPRSFPINIPFVQNLTEAHILLRQLRRARIVRHKLAQLVAKHREAAVLEHYDRGAGLELRRQDLEHALERVLRLFQHAVVVIGPAAAHVLRRQRSEEHTSELQSPCNLVC